MLYLVDGVSDGMFLGKFHTIGRTRVPIDEVAGLLTLPFIAHEFPTSRYPINDKLAAMEELGIDISQAEIRSGRLALTPGDALLVVRVTPKKGFGERLTFTLWEVLPPSLRLSQAERAI